MGGTLQSFRDRALKSTAYHEAGHTVAAALLGMPLREAGVHVDSMRCGVALIWSRKPSTPRNTATDIAEWEHTVCMLYAGYVAQLKFFPESPSEAALNDESTANALLAKMYQPENSPAWSTAERRLRKEAQELVEERWDAIRTLAETLWSRVPVPRVDLGQENGWSNDSHERCMTGTEIKKLLEQFQVAVQIVQGPEKNYISAHKYPNGA